MRPLGPRVEPEGNKLGMCHGDAQKALFLCALCALCGSAVSPRHFRGLRRPRDPAGQSLWRPLRGMRTSRWT